MRYYKSLTDFFNDLRTVTSFDYCNALFDFLRLPLIRVPTATNDGWRFEFELESLAAILSLGHQRSAFEWVVIHIIMVGSHGISIAVRETTIVYQSS